MACDIFCSKNILAGTIFFKNAYACKKVEIPPKEIINVHKLYVMFVESGVWLKSRQPCVISPIPQKMAVKSCLEKPIFSSKDIKNVKIVLDVITSNITNVKHITPPIKSIEFIEDVTLSEKFISTLVGIL